GNPGTGAVIGEPPQQAEDRALQHESSGELAQRELAVLRVGGILIVDQAPHPVKQLLSDEPRREPRGDRDRLEHEAHELRLASRTAAASTPTPATASRCVVTTSLMRAPVSLAVTLALSSASWAWRLTSVFSARAA